MLNSQNLDADLRNAIFFNAFSYMNDKELIEGNTCGVIDELHTFLSNDISMRYINASMKMNRKKDSMLITATQNIEDYEVPERALYAKPLLAIPSHKFIFNQGDVNPKTVMDALQLSDAEFDKIRNPERGRCLYKCGTERYLLRIEFPSYITQLFGNAGGR